MGGRGHRRNRKDHFSSDVEDLCIRINIWVYVCVWTDEDDFVNCNGNCLCPTAIPFNCID